MIAGIDVKCFKQATNQFSRAERVHRARNHHFYTEKEIQQLIARGKEINAKLVTTEKDFIKIPKKFHDNIHEICIELQFNQEEQLFDIINHCLN